MAASGSEGQLAAYSHHQRTSGRQRRSVRHHPPVKEQLPETLLPMHQDACHTLQRVSCSLLISISLHLRLSLTPSLSNSISVTLHLRPSPSPSLSIALLMDSTLSLYLLQIYSKENPTLTPSWPHSIDIPLVSYA